MIDIHTHVLAGIDDGALNMDISLEMLRLSENSGVKHIIATPHVIERHNAPSWQTILDKTQELQLVARNNGLTITIHPGAELELNWDILDILANDAYCLAGSQYVLVELPASMIPAYADDFWFELRMSGLTPILAHPERHNALMQQPKLLERWRKEGLLMQCNAGSLIGLYGGTVQKHMQTLLAKDYVDYVASDAHNNTRRNTDLTAIHNLLIEQFGAAYANKLLAVSPQELLQL